MYSLKYSLKTKFEISTYEEKMKILALAPQSWNLVEIQAFFWLHRARKARYLEEKDGPLTGYQIKVRDGISEELINEVIVTYEDDENSRIMPSCKYHKCSMPKRRILCTVTELYIPQTLMLR
ncbi:unnamed protein product [Lepeophtheirus salmonis]|uniref:(salmon louse) hypothetical protein n=1 Tax=Lepeophtheirus salmonis TaxID=72036 RepID=A0A7R8HDQ7_LEPSM|nr:unnamed protein product [Lepeophtheirus salmonis]CAF3015730.1 unnamed protein product [Lepeophtheirus salmonis]